LANIVFGTLSVSSPVVEAAILNTSIDVNLYPLVAYFIGGDVALFQNWVSQYTMMVSNIVTPGFPPEFITSIAAGNAIPGIVYQNQRQPPVIFNYTEWTPLASKIAKLAANNNYWNNNSINNIDINTSGSPINQLFNFFPPGKTAYDWHIKPQTDGSYGDLIMDSPAIKEIHAALNAGKWGINPDDPTQPRVDNLGWRIERGNQVLGIRVNPDGTIDEALEKTTNRRLHVEDSAENDEQEYNPNCFGSKGMFVRHLPNKFNPSGTVAGGYRKVRDIPQLLAELHEQANAAMGYQEGTAIEIQLDGKTYRYPNQLALMTELFVTMKQTATYAKGSFFSSLIAEQSIKEVIAGLGLRTVDKYLEFTVAGKATRLYYKGISASQSIRRKLSAVATNVGMVIGNII
jgi:hypothetical protein